MRKLRKNYIFLPLLVLTLVLFNHKAYSFVGEYTATSASTIANNSYQGNEGGQKVAFPAVLAVAAGVVVGVVFVVGVIDGWNSIGKAIYNGPEVDYDSKDFSKYDGK